MGKSFRIFELMIYPDSEIYVTDDVVKAATEYFDEWAYILHDSDVLPETGEVKKAHIHFLGRCESARQIAAVSNKCGIPENAIQIKNSFKFSVRYLVHLDQPEKYQYSNDKIISNLDVTRYLNGKDESMSVSKIFSLMDEYKPASIDELTMLVIKNGLWSTYRRSYSIFKDILHERKVI